MFCYDIIFVFMSTIYKVWTNHRASEMLPNSKQGKGRETVNAARWKTSFPKE